MPIMGTGWLGMFNPKPKPEKGGKKREDDKRKRALQKYRGSQVPIAISRDNDQCAICHFKHGRYRKRQEVHHVYSRGRKSGDFREHYTSMLCVCKECHPPPIQIPGGSATLGWVEDILKRANETPINGKFEHEIHMPWM